MEGNSAILTKSFNRLKVGGLAVSGIAVLIIMGIIVVDVTLRNLFNSSISGNYEIIQKYFMPLAIFPAMALTYSSGLMPRLGMFVEKLSAKSQNVIHVILTFIDLFVMVLVTVYTWNYAMQALAEKLTFPAGGGMYPLYPILFLVPIGFAMLGIEIIYKIIEALKKHKSIS